jgi:hypothetical protein
MDLPLRDHQGSLLVGWRFHWTVSLRPFSNSLLGSRVVLEGIIRIDSLQIVLKRGTCPRADFLLPMDYVLFLISDPSTRASITGLTNIVLSHCMQQTCSHLIRFLLNLFFTAIRVFATSSKSLSPIQTPL